MSAGSFTRSRYQSDSAQVLNIRVQPETLLLTVGGQANTAPAGSVTAGTPSAKVSGSSRQIGVNARRVRLQFTGAAPDGYKPDGILTVPWLSQATFGAIARGQTGTYLGVGVVVVGKSPERVN